MVTGVRRPVMAAVPNFLMVTGVMECSSSSSMCITGVMGLEQQKGAITGVIIQGN